MRMDQYMGLNKWAHDTVNATVRVQEVGTRTYPDGHTEEFNREVDLPLASKEVIGQIEGIYDRHVADLHRYTLPSGAVYEEFVQATAWSSGPCYFIALKDESGRVIKDSCWTEKVLRTC